MGKSLLRFVLALLRLGAAFSLLTAAEPAFANSRAEVLGTIRTGGVSAELEIGTHTDNTRLQPGSIASYQVTAVNLEERAWVRVGFELAGPEESREIMPLHFTGLSEEAIVRGNYLYSRRPLEKGEYLKFCDGFLIPDLKKVPETMTFQVRAVPEAMQAVGGSSALYWDEPWKAWKNADSGQEERMLLERSADGSLRLVMDRKQIQFTGQLFADMEALMPGETAEETVSIEQKGAGMVGLRLRLMEILPAEQTEYLEKEGKQSATPSEAENGERTQRLLELLKLEILRDGKLLYDNHFLDTSLKNGIHLGYFLRGEHQLKFRIHVPKELENSFARKAASLQWEFEVKTENGSGSGSGSSGGGRPSVAGDHIYADPDGTVKTALKGGTWKLLEAKTHQWSYLTPRGMQAKNGWLYVHNPYADGGKGENEWFKFNADGIMEYGWIRSANQNWYYCHAVSDGRLGSMRTGWHQDGEDGRRYYLDPVNGIMQTGWRTIENKNYYFAGLSDIPEQTWYFEAFDRALGDTAFGKWVYKRIGLRSYGSLYRNEQTPDGRFVNQDGAEQTEVRKE